MLLTAGWVTLAACAAPRGNGNGGAGADGAADATLDAAGPTFDTAFNDVGNLDNGTPRDAAALDTGSTTPEPEEPPFDPGMIPPVTTAETGDDWYAHDAAALEALARMYATGTGQWTSGPRWSFANDVAAATDSFARSGGETHRELIAATYELNSGGMFLDDLGYDDEAWWGLAWAQAYDVTGERRYLDAARVVFQDMSTAWTDQPCGGGVWWNRHRDYKNAITNELFLQLAATLHNRATSAAEARSYLEWSLKSWKWFAASGMINANGLVNDGLSIQAGGACVNNKSTTWTYNQGVIVGALVELFDATGDAQFLKQANVIADATITRLSDKNGVLHEPCAATGCDGDQVGFKGAFTRNLARLYDLERLPRHHDFLLLNARALWRNARGVGDVIGTDWSGPFDVASAPRQSSAMMAISSLADVSSFLSPFLRPAAHSSFTHAIGARDQVLGWACDAATCPTPGLMQAGPFVESVPPGAHSLRVRATVAAVSTSTQPLFTIQVFNRTASTVVAERAVAWSEFAAAFAAQTFSVPYTIVSRDPIEFRVLWQALPAGPRVVLKDTYVDGEEAATAANLGHECGHLDGRSHWSADRFAEPAPCFLTRGAAVTLSRGDYAAAFELRVDTLGDDQQELAALSIYDRATRTDVASVTVRRGDFRTTMFQPFFLPFRASSDGRFELRTRWLAAAGAPRLSVRGVHVRRATEQTAVALPFNARGLGTAPGDGSLDTAGRALDLPTLTALLSPSSTFERFTLGGPGKNVLVGGGNVPVPMGNYRALSLLAFAMGGNQLSQPITLLYANGTSEVVSRSFSDWLAPSPLPEERIRFAMAFRWSPKAREYGNFHVFQHTLPVDPARRLVSIQFPASPSIVVLSATLSSAN